MNEISTAEMLRAMVTASEALEKMASALDGRPWITRLFSGVGADAMHYAQLLVSRSSAAACEEMRKRFEAESKLRELESTAKA